MSDIDKAAEILSDLYGNDWIFKIDVDELNMQHSDMCIVGQASGGDEKAWRECVDIADQYYGEDNGVASYFYNSLLRDEWVAWLDDATWHAQNSPSKGS